MGTELKKLYSEMSDIDSDITLVMQSIEKSANDKQKQRALHVLLSQLKEKHQALKDKIARIETRNGCIGWS